jgi:hypothetical protein
MFRPLLSRRQILAAAAGLILPSRSNAAVFGNPPEVTGRILGASAALGHRLRSGSFPAPSQTIERSVVIVGGGIAGLSAAWKLQKSGVDDFLLLELEKQVGGNAASGANAVSAYPWGAHYVPLLTQEATAAQELFADLKIITGRENEMPVYDDYFLCSDPHERLYMYGFWQDGMVPELGVPEADQAQYRTFSDAMERFKALRGKDGRKAFAIPIDLSSQDPAILELDAVSMADYLTQNGWNSQYLRWYVDYCCKDDYGAALDQVSAWAGIHYFAARTGQAANADPQTVVTWPEGNGWIVNQLKRRMSDHLHTSALAYSIRSNGQNVEIAYLDVARNVAVLIKANAVILAVPRFVAQYLLKADGGLEPFHYSPWMVANVTLDAMPAGEGVPLSWDNMIYGSKLLGYVVATHQNLNRIQTQTVLTYYWPLAHLPPDQAREEALARPYKEWRNIILDELTRVHPELDGHIKGLDVWLWGHGMIRPTPGFIWGPARKKALAAQPPVFFAHSDMSGISIFEEANYRGVDAAQRVMGHIRHPYVSSL